MGNTGFDTPFYIRRKRNLYRIQFLMYLDGADSGVSAWTDKEDTNVDATVGGSAQLAPYGYLPDGTDDNLSDNLGVNGVTIEEFTIAAVVVRNEMGNNEAVCYGLFGSTHYPRIYFVGTTLHAEIKMDGTVKSITVSNVDTLMNVGQPHFIVFRGSVSTGIEVLIDGVSRGTQTDTGTVYSVGTGDFKLMKDTNLSYFQKGALRFLAVCADKMTDAQLEVWRAQLEYEGHFDVWRDDFAKWSGNTTFETGAPAVSGSPYQVTLVES